MSTRLDSVPLESEREGTIYYILQTGQMISNCSSCPPGQVCHTMNYLAENSHKFFSSDHVNVTLIFMCGVHKFSSNLIVQNLHSFVMKGGTSTKDNVIINMLREETVELPSGTEPNKFTCTSIQFFNTSYVNITTLTMRCPSVLIEGGLLSIKNSNLNGHSNIREIFSAIMIVSKTSEAFIDSCTFKQNCFVVSNRSAGITVNNSSFQLYRHKSLPVIMAYSSAITFTGIVNITDSIVSGSGTDSLVSGTAVFLSTNYEQVKASLTIATDAVVHFVNLTCGFGGAVGVDDGFIDISANAMVVFMHNHATSEGGAVYLVVGSINVGVNSVVLFAYNTAADVYGGAIYIELGAINIQSDATLSFIYNSAPSGGAVVLDVSTFEIGTGASVFFFNNTATQGGAIYVTSNSKVYINNSDESCSNFHRTKVVFFKNSASLGGALYVSALTFSFEVKTKASIEFVNNTATDVGGAVYCEMQLAVPCIFIVKNYSVEINFTWNFSNRNIGQHLYGTSVRDDRCLRHNQGIPSCVYDNTTKHINISLHPDLSEILSPVSSAPWRVCLCDINGRPQCTNLSQIFTCVSVYRGETFTLPACLVGYDFGTMTGVVHAQIVSESSKLLTRLQQFQYDQLVKTEKCSTLNYTVYTKQNAGIMLYLTIQGHIHNPEELTFYKDILRGLISYYRSNDQFGCVMFDLLTTPIFINVTLLPGCPPGLTLIGDPPGCGCYLVLTTNDFQCSIKNKTGVLVWNTMMWVNASFNARSQSKGIIYNPFCPLNYCKFGMKVVHISNDPSEQCTSNRTGILCGACKENFSLAIGSSQCIECPNNSNLALTLLFTAGGVLLVFFILVLNLTVTEGLVNGLIFYANIVWAYKIILFPSGTQDSRTLSFLRGFVAWLNLDFGIEACFFNGLNNYWKTWLQFLFPSYIWAIAGVIVVACRYSSRLTNLIGSRAVPLLATLFLLSCMKLLRIIIDATSVTVIEQYPQNTSFAVWSLDGNLLYCHHPHIYLFVVTIGALVFLWLPYTFVLLFVQPLRKVSHLRLLKWMNHFAPVYDAYFYPLKDKHHYWFGVLLFVRGMLLVILTVTYTTSPKLNVFILSVTMTALLSFTSANNVYNRLKVRLFESFILMNLLILTAGTRYMWESTASRIILLQISIGFCFIQFCVVILHSLIKLSNCYSGSYISCYRWRQGYGTIDESSVYDDITHERIESPHPESLIQVAKEPGTVTF